MSSAIKEKTKFTFSCSPTGRVLVLHSRASVGFVYFHHPRRWRCTTHGSCVSKLQHKVFQQTNETAGFVRMPGVDLGTKTSYGCGSKTYNSQKWSCFSFL